MRKLPFALLRLHLTIIATRDEPARILRKNLIEFCNKQVRNGMSIPELKVGLQHVLHEVSPLGKNTSCRNVFVVNGILKSIHQQG